jgi:flagellin
LNTTFQGLITEINRVAADTQFNGVTLLNGSTTSVVIQVGAGDTSNDRITVSLSNLTTGTAGLNIAVADVSTQSDAQAAISTLTNAINTVTTDLASLGASETNLNAAVNVDNVLVADLDAAKSRIMDADFAAESSALAKFNILNQSSISMLAQANSTPQAVLKLLG